MTVPKESEVDILIVGAGPTGLGAATRLNQLGIDSWTLVEAEGEAGGLATTGRTPEGFLFDMGGHVIFSHFDYFDQLLDTAVGSGDSHWNTLERVSYIWIRGRWVPYPFQNNLYCLPLEDKIKCIDGVIEATKLSAAAPQVKPKTFDDWIIRVMGEGIADLFMRPYNFKVWAYPTKDMQCEWLGERVATVDAKKVIENVLRNEPAAGWGPNAVFRFPKDGGTGGIWKKVASLLPQDRMLYNKKLERLDVANKLAVFRDGSIIRYKKMLNTVPLDITLSIIEGEEFDKKEEWTTDLKYSSTHVIGLGIRGSNPHDKKCWLYFPEDNCPFYRATVFSHYADSNVPSHETELKTLRHASTKTELTASTTGHPKPGPYWSLMLEVSESNQYKPVDMKTIVDEAIQGCINTTLLKTDDEIVSIYHRRLERGYPTPHLKRDGVLRQALPLLQKKDVWNRGRFGNWMYEIANQDHSCMVGVEAVDNILFGSEEFTLNHPSMANSRRNTSLKYTHPVEDIKLIASSKRKLLGLPAREAHHGL
ncbi:hypothetical protein FOL47_005808 [Perkinsus chesapeaki]|uniref:UDP-galactopyranose mutase n=1 Tax=Perkinsus chesapeaki TaxID=330153 RepID=A0A7J6LVP2_PERCH|nr:hypothetical protein FOL47_005808 [Perkinsus chesapeaki]